MAATNAMPFLHLFTKLMLHPGFGDPPNQIGATNPNADTCHVHADIKDQTRATLDDVLSSCIFDFSNFFWCYVLSFNISFGFVLFVIYT